MNFLLYPMNFPSDFMDLHGFAPAWLLYINRFGSKTCNVATGDVKVEESWRWNNGLKTSSGADGVHNFITLQKFPLLEDTVLGP